MQSISEVIPKIEQNSAVEDLLKQVIAVPQVTEFIRANQSLTKDKVTMALPIIIDYLKYHDIYLDDDRSTASLVPGMSARLVYNNGVIEMELFPNAAYQQQLLLGKYIEQMHVSPKFLEAEFSDWSKEEIKALDAVLDASLLMSQINEPKGHQGLYIYGTYGVGKTHLLGAIAHNLFDKRIPSLIVFWPELVRGIKQDFKSAGNIVDRLKYIDVLMIDDLGAEMQSSFSRDEILLPILNHRMNHQKLTFFTSNLDLEALRQHFTYTQRGEKEPLKAERIMERIRSLAQPVLMSGSNRRNE